MKKVTVLGSTGSIGKNTLEIVGRHPERFSLHSICAWSNVEELAKQANIYKPRKIALGDATKIKDLKMRLKANQKIFVGQEGIDCLASDKKTDIVVIAISGSKALSPILAAIKAKRQIALANKEALVMAGSIIMDESEKQGVQIIPVDSEQSAIWQCLQGKGKKYLKGIYLTASGGSLNKIPKSKFSRVTKKQILKHPRWKMGRKITVDSATLMNKGFEIIEAYWLFLKKPSCLKVVIHPEAIIHSMVEFQDGTVLAQLGITDMRLPIQYSLTYPERIRNELPALDFSKIRSLTFQKPNLRKFPCLELAYQALGMGTSALCVLNAADEEAVRAFLENRLDFINIPKIIDKILEKHRVKQAPDLEELLYIDSCARREANRLIKKFN